MTAFDNTRLALLTYELGYWEREADWASVESDLEIERCAANDAAALRKVQEAYYQDTKHINSLENCLLVDLQFMRRMAK
jgi:hypothetical protein